MSDDVLLKSNVSEFEKFGKFILTKVTNLTKT